MTNCCKDDAGNSHPGEEVNDCVCSDPLMRHSAVQEKLMAATPRTMRIKLVAPQDPGLLGHEEQTNQACSWSQGEDASQDYRDAYCFI